MAQYNVVISDQAWRQMGNCVLFLAEKDVNAALSLKTCLIDSIKRLEAFPARFPFLNERYIPANKYRKMFVEHYYLILYQIKDNAVFVEYVLDCRQDYRWLVK